MFPLLHGRRWWHFRRFEGLLLSLACMFLLNIIFPGKIYGGTAQACYLPLQLLAGINLYGRLRPGFWAAALTAAGILALHPFQALSSMPRALQFSLLLLHGLFFFIILLEVFIQLYRAQTHRLHLDARQTLCAGLSGLLLIGYSGFFLFLLLENFQPGSFRGPDPGGVSLQDLFSFSYISLMTIGYGDITPHTWVAKNATVLVALIAYMYSLVIVAMIVNQFAENRKLKQQEKARLSGSAQARRREAPPSGEND